RAAEQLAGPLACALEHLDSVAPGLGGRHRAGERELGDVVDDAAELPDATERLVLAEVGLPDAVAPRRRRAERPLALLGQLAALAAHARRLQQCARPQRAAHGRLAGVEAVGLKQRPDLAMPPGRPLKRQLRGRLLDPRADRCRPRPLARRAALATAVVAGARAAGQRAEAAHA